MNNRPQCQNPLCKSNKPALVVLGGMFVCGECVINYQKNRNKQIIDMMNADMVTE